MVLLLPARVPCRATCCNASFKPKISVKGTDREDSEQPSLAEQTPLGKRFSAFRV